jgi:hypothetical protein
MVSTILILAFGCAYQEELPEKDITGTVVLPAAALTRQLPNGETVTDPRLIGPVFLGAYAGIDDVAFSYPHPTMGPIVNADTPGDTFPYGGTTVGRYDFACYEALACKVVTGRFADYADILDYFQLLGSPVTDDNGAEVANGSTFQQACYEYYYATSDAEMAFIGADQFTENADGDWEASFSMPHTVFVDGMVIWGWMDAPSVDLANTSENGSFSTCDVGSGRNPTEYDEEFYEGRVYYNALNIPSRYIFNGDWVGQGADEAKVTLKEDESGEMVPTNPVVRLDFGFGVEDAE